MAGKRLTKLKSVLKKWNSFGRNSIRSPSDEDDYPVINPSSSSRDNLRPVYVGKSRRRYLVGPDVADHPLFRELVSRSGYVVNDHLAAHEGMSVSCEVVLFEHLLWMLENSSGPIDSSCELADFYTCC
ncbi:hypothetical protein MLD38_006971 [Melastoma candidum]|uniref:Uncharacterized protein n=1 Tax=Melastoma candidum TaxID=119954 RepID=A0ACB9RSM0_9MYRT|nr:hypothetical protein MLD38_006971 [Melastoma candidum]